MDTLVFYVFLGAVLTGAMAFIVQMFSGKVSIAPAVGLSVFVATLVLDFIIMYFGMPTFAHWATGGIPTLVFSNLLCGIVVHGLFAFVTSDLTGASINFIVSLIGAVLYGFAIFSVPTVDLFCIVNEDYDRLAGILQLEAITPELEKAEDTELMKVVESTALLDATGKMPPEIGSYTEFITPTLQTVDGEPIFVTGLAVTNWAGFRDTGKALPGFAYRPAAELAADTVFQSGYAMQYVPDARWLADLTRHVYLNFGLTCNCVIDGLYTLELDDKHRPMYTGTVMRYTVGSTGMEPAGIIVVDPQSGAITSYDWDKIPEWVDRVGSFTYVWGLVDWWAHYSEWDSNCPSAQETTAGQMKIDGGTEVLGADGRLYFQFTITSVGRDTTLLYEIRVDPKTLKAYKYPADGKTLEAIDNLIDQESFNAVINPQFGAEPEGCERQPLLDKDRITWYCVLVNRPSITEVDPSSGESITRPNPSAGAVQGYAFLQQVHDTDPNKIIFGTTFEEAWNLFRLQVSEDLQQTGDSEIQTELADFAIFTGVMTAKSDRAINGMVQFILVNDENPLGVWFQAPENNFVLALTSIGDEVTVTAFDLAVSSINDVISIENSKLPPLNLDEIEIEETEVITTPLEVVP